MTTKIQDHKILMQFLKKGIQSQRLILHVIYIDLEKHNYYLIIIYMI